ncbi:crossveinless d [Carabus blaptoides fortunei]
MLKLIHYAFALLYLHSTGVTTKEVKELVYDYNANIITKSNSNNQSIVQWTLKGNLIVQHTENCTIMKLNNLTTSIYNGPVQAQINSTLEDLSIEAQVLHLPVVVYYDDYDEEEEMLISHISTVPEDPEWSVNIKRAICSLFQFRFSFLTGDDRSDALEDNIYGNCEVYYSGKNFGKNGFLLKKKLIHSSCTNDNLDISEPHWYKSKIDDHLVLNISTERIYIFTDINDREKISRIDSTSNISYTAIRGESVIMNVIQHQSLELINYSSNECIDSIRNTVNKNVVFELGHSIRFGTDWVTKTSEQMLQEYNKITSELKVEYNKIHLEHIDGRMNDLVTRLIELLNTMNSETLRQIAEDKSDKVTSDLFISLLPYIETKHTAKLTKLFLTSESFKKYYIIKFLLTVATKDMLKNVEDFVNLKISNGRHPLHIINFAILVAKLNEEKLISKEEFMKYVHLYLDTLNSKNASTDYAVQMPFLFGLINMADGLNIDVILELALETKYSRHIRSTVIFGFKKQLISHPELMFITFWPVVENISEHLEVRVAALDVLLSTQLSEQQFYTIINTYNGHLIDMHEQHIQHYIYTALQSMQNTAFYNPFGDLVATAFKNFTLSKSAGLCSTGNYRLSYIDSTQSFGATYQVQVVADPDRNAISSIQVSYNGFALSTLFQSYTARFKLEGIPQYLFADIMLKRRLNNDIDVAELIELIKKNHYQNKEDIEIHESSDSVSYTLKHRSSSKVEESITLVNPLDNVRYGVRKFRMSRVLLDIPLVLDWKNLTIRWKSYDINLNIAADRSLSTYVRSSPQVLSRYCTLCQRVSENRDSGYQQAIFPVHILGIKLNISVAGKLAKTERNNLLQFDSNSYTFPLGKFFLVQDFLANHFLFAPSYEPYSISILQKSTIQTIPTETSLQFDATVDTMTYRNDTIENYTMILVLVLTETNLNTYNIINQQNVTCKINSQVKIKDLSTRLLKNIDIYYSNLKGQKLCMDFRMLYPSRRDDIFSKAAVEPAVYNMTVSKGHLRVNGCETNDTLVQLLGTFSVTDEQLSYVKEMKEYDICKQDSTGLRYTPPSYACNVVLQMLNKYPRTDIYINTKQTHEKKIHMYTTAFVECFRTPRVALTFRKLRNGKLGFKLWSDSMKLITFVANDSLVVTLDGQQLKENYDKKIGNDHLRISARGVVKIGRSTLKKSERHDVF